MQRRNWYAVNAAKSAKQRMFIPSGQSLFRKFSEEHQMRWTVRLALRMIFRI